MLLFFGRMARLGNRFLRFLGALITVFLSVSCIYILYDASYFRSTTYLSRDLMAYAPKEDDLTGLDALYAMNEDIRFWLEIDGTDISFPVVQGMDDLYYAYRDIYRQSNLAGSIYLSSQNRMNDIYLCVYGHHLENGGRFGDLDKFEDEGFLLEHQTGTITTLDAVYDLHIFACVITDAYNSMVYDVSSRTEDNIGELETFIENNAVGYIDISTLPYDQIIAMSTCSDAITNGRTVRFATLTERQEAEEKAAARLSDQEAGDAARRIAEYHDEVSLRRWSVLNLLTLLLGAYLILPIGSIRKKYRFPISLRKVFGRKRKIRFPLRRLCILEVLILCCMAVLFIYAENLSDPITIVDTWTPYFLLGLGILITVDIFGLSSFRFRRT